MSLMMQKKMRTAVTNFLKQKVNISCHNICITLPIDTM